MKRICTTVVLLGVLAGVTLSAGAAEMKKALIFNFPGEGYKASEAQQAIAALEAAGFVENQQVNITIWQPQSSEEAAAKVNELKPDVVIDFSSRNQVSEASARVSQLGRREMALIAPPGAARTPVTRPSLTSRSSASPSITERLAVLRIAACIAAA